MACESADSADPFTFPFLLRGVFGGGFPVYPGHQGHQVVVIDFEVGAALRARVPQVGVKELSPVVQVPLRHLEVELE